MKYLPLLTIFCAAIACAADSKPKPVLPAVPEVLKPLKASIRATGPLEGVTLVLTTETPLTEEQWTAIASLPVRRFAITGKGADNDLMARLAKMPIEGLLLEHSPANDEGAAHFAEMKELKSLFFSHSSITGKGAVYLTDHPSLETFRSDGACGAKGMEHIATCKNLRVVRLMHGAANDTTVKALAHHPRLEILDLNPVGSAELSDAALASIETMSELKELAFKSVPLTFDGGLVHLKSLTKLAKLTLTEVDLPDADLAKLKAALPNVAITFTPMPKEYRAKWDQMVAKRK